MTPLPIDSLLPEIAAQLRRGASVVIEAPPGAGKTTRVPPALLTLVKGEVLVLEPRRLAARLAARRVASELGERVGETVGYQVRFEDVGGPRTRLRFVTESILFFHRWVLFAGVCVSSNNIGNAGVKFFLGFSLPFPCRPDK